MLKRLICMNDWQVSNATEWPATFLINYHWDRHEKNSGKSWSDVQYWEMRSCHSWLNIEVIDLKFGLHCDTLGAVESVMKIKFRSILKFCRRQHSAQYEASVCCQVHSCCWVPDPVEVNMKLSWRIVGWCCHPELKELDMSYDCWLLSNQS